MNATRHNKPPLPHIWKNLKDGEVAPIPELKRDRMECLRYVFSDERDLELVNSLLEQMTTTRSNKLGVLESDLRGMTGGEFALLRERLNALYLEPVIVRGNIRPTPDENGDPYNLEFAIYKGKAWDMAASDIKELIEERSRNRAVYSQRPRTYTIRFEVEQSRLYYPEQKKYCGLAKNQRALVDLLRYSPAQTAKDILQSMENEGVGYGNATALAHGVVAINTNVEKYFGIEEFIQNRGGYTINGAVKLK